MTYKHFKESEFACPCCGVNLTSQRLIEMLDTARELAQIPFHITSGYRCKKHNKEIGGKERSKHLSGIAADIACDNDADRGRMLPALYLAGFKRIGIAKNFIHVDIAEGKAVWLY